MLGGDPEEEEEEEEKEGGGKSSARSRPQRREARELGVEAARSLRLSSGRDRRSLNPDGPHAPLAIRVPRAAPVAAAKANGTRASEKEQTEAAPQL